ncbi:MAG: ABC transporter ATP-binding protein [Nitrososphaerales archaeon]
MVNIKLEGITHIYNGKIKAVDNLNIEMPHGKFTAILGPSGCGKTTTLKIIAGLLRPTFGKVYFDKEDVTALPAEKRNIAMVFQFPIVYSTMTVFDNLAFPLRLKKLSRNLISNEVKMVAEFLKLQQYLHIKPVGLPADVKQKIALGRALIKGADILILDEPLTNIEPKARVELREKILEIKRQKSLTIIYVTHDQSEALTLADLIAVMKDGKILQFDLPENMYTHPKNTFVAWFLGNPGMNLFKGFLRRIEDKSYLELEGGLRIQLQIELLKLIQEKYSNEEIIFGIRPENVEVSYESIPESIQGRILVVEDTGLLQIATIKVGDIELKVKTSKILREEQCVYIRFPSHFVKIFDKNGELIYG